ncbi:MAG: hypothetical protein DLM58_07575 [Pseudonocardiales bacterium]|nr:MAG: hypothetical protein DLM58_07575 [Pseudonocardiales bacterium]
MTENRFGADEGGEHGNPAAPLIGEALRLVSSVQEWAQDWAHRGNGEPEQRHTGSDCQWCPLCQFAAVLRGEHPEITDRVAEAGTALVGALRAIVEAASGVAGTGGRAPHRPPGPRVQKINLNDES